MVIAIRHKDRAKALESGKAALTEMDCTRPFLRSAFCTGPQTQSDKTSNRTLTSAKAELMVSAHN
jgi:hypothetical protein